MLTTNNCLLKAEGVKRSQLGCTGFLSMLRSFTVWIFILKFQLITFYEYKCDFAKQQFHLGPKDEYIGNLYFGMESFCLPLPHFVLKQVYSKHPLQVQIQQEWTQKGYFQGCQRGSEVRGLDLYPVSGPAAHPVRSSTAAAAG